MKLAPILAFALLVVSNTFAGTITIPGTTVPGITVECPGVTPQWNPNTSTVICQSSGSTPPVTPPPVTVGDFAGCPRDAITHKAPTGASNYTFDTENGGSFGGNVVSVRFVTGAASSNTNVITIVEFRSGQVTRQAALSTKPCDFSEASAAKSPAGAPAVDTSVSSGFPYRVGTPDRRAYTLAPNTAYYVNVRNVDCPSVCGARITIPRR